MIPRIVLASASPRRAELLRAAGINFDVVPANADETAHESETPDAYVRRVAEAKGRNVLARATGMPVLSADTIVVVNDAILTKPLDDPDARRMLRLLSGRRHHVLTAVSLFVSERLETRVASTAVDFAQLMAEEIDWYVGTGEPLDKAGAYAIQGYASRFVTRVDGSYSNVVGLPVALTYEMLKRLTA